MENESRKSNPACSPLDLETMKSEIYLIGYCLGKGFSLQSSRLVTDSNLCAPSASAYVNF